MKVLADLGGWKSTQTIDTWRLGWRMAEIAVATLQSAGNWLRANKRIDAFEQAPPGWRAALKQEWEGALQARPVPDRPRHEDQEIDQLWDNLHKADPRAQLALDLGAEYRLGQVLRGNRADLDLSPGAGVGHGTFRIWGQGRKGGALVFLTQDQRATVDRALGPEGFLVDFESAFRERRLQDYPLFPGGALVDGKAKLLVDSRLMSRRMCRRTLLKKFHAFETACDVPCVKGRGWYGVRRRSTDRVRRVTDDERVRDASGGWAAGSSTRQTVYMTQEDETVLREAAKARTAARRSTAPDAAAAPDKPNGKGTAALAALEQAGLSDAVLEAIKVLVTTDLSRNGNGDG